MDSDNIYTIDEKYKLELIIKAKELNLAANPYWHTLLHYKTDFFGGFTSLVDDEKFFFSKTGKTNSDEELIGTIENFFVPAKEGVTHPIIKFPARYAWLKEKLNIDVTKLPLDGDAKFQKFYKQINPSKITLVFPSGYMNSPASMYGHTLLIIEADNNSRLLARAVNYAALTDETFGPFFALKGLFGLYKGYYSFLPYYEKIREYNDGEMRDVWEYELQLNSSEMERLVRHMIEMENIYSDYFFINENCSYNLLFLIEAAKPETKITDAFGFGVEPIDTIRVAKKNNLYKDTVYRPSLFSKIQYLRSMLTNEEQQIVLKYCKGKSEKFEIDQPDIDDKKKIIMCDLASEYLRFYAVNNDISEKDYRSRFFSVLSIRNSLPQLSFIKDIPTPIAPEESHLSRRIAFETGKGIESYYTQFSYRQSCHELMDPDEGYNKNSQIVFGNVSGRYYYNDNKFVLQRFDLIDIISLPPSDRFYVSPCYKISTGLLQNPWEKMSEKLSYQLMGAIGLSTEIYEFLQIYGMVGFKSFFAPDYENYTDLLGGGESGILTILGPWKNHMYASAYRAPFGETHTRYSAGLSERIRITDSVSVAADYSYNKDYSFDWHEFSAKVNFYF